MRWFRWCGLPPTAKELAKLITHTSIVEGYSATSLYPPPSPLRTIVHTLPNVPFDKSLISTINGPTHSSVYLLKALHHARRNKTPEELDLMRHAMGITTRAHKDLMRRCGRGETLDEGTAEAGFVKICREGGAREQAYTPIVARGTNAGTLHYIRNGDSFGEERTVLLVDAGAEYENYASDITRCTPLGNGGKFTKESREIYELVLEMQTFAFGLIKPGGDYEVIQKEMHRIVAEGFLTLGIFKGGSQEEIVQSGLTTAFYPHGVGHLLGLDVHDVGGLPEGKSKDPLCKYLRLRVPLEIGFVVTVEPGYVTFLLWVGEAVANTVTESIYFNPFLQAPFLNSQYLDHEVLARYQVVGGIRIEDNLVVTESGFENLSKAIPKTVKEVEEYIAGTRD